MIFKKFYIKPNEIGILYDRSDFKKFLPSGMYQYFGLNWQVKTYDLNQPEAKLENLELLLATRTVEIEEKLSIIRTSFNQVALVRVGQNWLTIPPNQIEAFWRGFIEVEIQIFNLDEDMQLNAEYTNRLRGIDLNGIAKSSISESEIGLLYIKNNFIRPLEAGEYAFWNYDRSVAIKTLSRTVLNPDFPLEEILIEKHPDFVANYCQIVELQKNQIAIVRYREKVISVLPPTSRKLFWLGVEVEIIDISNEAKLSADLIAELVSGTKTVAALCREQLHVCEVPPQHIGLLYIDSEFKEELPSGVHAWWSFGRFWQTETIDLRLQNIEVSGQEILSKDKVPLRLNLTAGFRIQDPLKAKQSLVNISDFLYKELQFALRAAVGEKTLDALLEDKGAIDRSIAEYISNKTQEYGIEVDSIGVKDIILPGEIKAILSKVVEAEKTAQANVIKLREETSATRSMLNTARVMEDNPIALRLKELEVLERIAEKIDRIQVNGSLDSILTELIQINNKPS
jgi:regulator of protease activity HflC (stomatin/prohibitin superfamily)